MDNESWRWVWSVLTAVLAIGEMVTAGFFILPFAVGAGAAAALAWLDVAAGVQWAVFLVVSVAAFVWLRRFGRREDEAKPLVGANRLDGRIGWVLEPIDRTTNGRVRIDPEEWRATTDGGPIEQGREVRVVDIRGARLVVEPVGPDA